MLLLKSKKPRLKEYFCDDCRRKGSIDDMELIEVIPGKGTSAQKTRTAKGGIEETYYCDIFIVCSKCQTKRQSQGWKVKKVKVHGLTIQSVVGGTRPTVWDSKRGGR